MMLDFRPVDCATQQPLTFLPGFVNQTIYGDRLESGWSFEPYRQSYSSFWSPAAGVDGRNATCQARARPAACFKLHQKTLYTNPQCVLAVHRRRALVGAIAAAASRLLPPRRLAARPAGGGRSPAAAPLACPARSASPPAPAQLSGSCMHAAGAPPRQQGSARAPDPWLPGMLRRRQAPTAA